MGYRKLDEKTREKKEAQLHEKWLHKFTYLRGLDGLLPSLPGKDVAKQNESSTDDKASGHDKQSASTDFFKVEQDTQSLERPIGQSQYDCLRRIGAQLQDYRKKGNRIVAIGILGNDAFDKLLILRALRPEFRTPSFSQPILTRRLPSKVSFLLRAICSLHRALVPISAIGCKAIFPISGTPIRRRLFWRHSSRSGVWANVKVCLTSGRDPTISRKNFMDSSPLPEFSKSSGTVKFCPLRGGRRIKRTSETKSRIRSSLMHGL
jgi:hypothetical protein